MSHSPTPRRRSITFRDDVDVQLIPNKGEILPEEKVNAWYGKTELKQLRKNARFVAETLQATDLFRSPDEMHMMVSQYGIDHEDISTTRGLELRMCSRRQERRSSAVRAILQAYSENKKNPFGLSDACQEFSLVAEKIAHESALADQDEAAKHSCSKGSMDDILCKQKRHPLSRRRRTSMHDLRSQGIVVSIN